MDKFTTKLNNWSTDFLDKSDEFIVDIESKPPFSKYKIVIDGVKPVSINRCSELSKYLSRLIDEDTELLENKGFTLEVSSPGADKPLTLLKQYFKHIGRQLEIETKNKTKLTGTLKNIENTEIILDIIISKKERREEKIEFKNIEKAIVKISFK